MRWNYLSIPKLQRLHRWSLGMDKQFHPIHYNGCNYLSMLGLKLNHVSKRGHCRPYCIRFFDNTIDWTSINWVSIIDWDKVPVFPRYTDDRIWQYNHLRHTTTIKYDNNWKGGYFRFDDDNKMDYYKYILSITQTRMGQFNTCNLIYCKKIIERTNPILDTLSTWYTQQAFIVLNACE